MYACTVCIFGIMSAFVVEMMYKVYIVCLYFITFSIMSAFVVKMMYKVYKILCLYGISGVLSIEAKVEVRVRAEFLVLGLGLI